MGRIYPHIFFAAFGFGPYECFFCRERTVPFSPVGGDGRDGGSLHIHHVDGNQSNNMPLNLAPAHNRCHRRWHVLCDGIRNRRGQRGFGEFGNRDQMRKKVNRNRTYRETMQWAFSRSGN